jgi:hypothetical protein
MEPRLVPQVGLSVSGKPALLISTAIDYFQLPNDFKCFRYLVLQAQKTIIYQVNFLSPLCQ